MTRILAINGPPRAGKDTLAEHLFIGLTNEGVRCAVTSLAEPIYNSLNLEYLYGDLTLDEIKKDPSFRNFITRFAENCVKPIFGETFFVCETVNKINKSNYDVVIISDLGFPVELEVLEVYYPVDIIRLEKENTSFNNDSRRYVGKHKYTVTNNSDKEALRKQAEWIIKDYI